MCRKSVLDWTKGVAGWKRWVQVASDSEAFDHFSSFFHIFPQESLARVGLSTQATCATLCIVDHLGI